jgi:hypothetical protein
LYLLSNSPQDASDYGGKLEKATDTVSPESFRVDSSLATAALGFVDGKKSQEQQEALRAVIEVASSWIDNCNFHPHCNQLLNSAWYPSRLLDIANARTKGRVHLTLGACSGGKYVTLSHCWGKYPDTVMKLTRDNMCDFIATGISVIDLPRTFQDAISFAWALQDRYNVKYIWIDSLCIIQDDREDWLLESTKMGEVYGHSFCNISATAAGDGSYGLSSERLNNQLTTETVDLRTDGIPSQKKTTKFQRCNILPLSFWDQNIEGGAVNLRSWVLQERLMSPRVIHFCKDQLVWECGERDAIGQRSGLRPIFQLRNRELIAGGRFKGLDPMVDGKMLREARLLRGRRAMRQHNRMHDPDVHLVPRIYGYELWKRTVEVYSKTQLTNPYDKLIALSGIAKVMASKLDDNYVAGIWFRYLASELLWHTNSQRSESGEYFFPSRRPRYYRCPSFSWASVDNSEGVTYAETTDTDLLISVEEAVITSAGQIHSTITSNGVQLRYGEDFKFGLVNAGHLLLTGQLRAITLEDSGCDDSLRYSWCFKEGSHTDGLRHYIVYLDDPGDVEIFGGSGEVFCMAVAWGSRSDSQKYLICLLLQLADSASGTYRRVGLTKISPLFGNGGKEAGLDWNEYKGKVPCRKWDSETGKHTVLIL